MDLRFSQPSFRRLGYLTLGVLSLMAIIYFRERTLFTDAAYQVFHLIVDGKPLIAHSRFGNVLVQVLPWLALKAQLPLQWILIAYSVSYPLLFGLLYWLIVDRLGNERLGWVLVLLFTLLSFDTFYHIQSEFYQGLAFLLLLFALIWKYPRLERAWLWAAAVVLIALIANSHKLTVVFFTFLWIYFLLIEPAFRHWRYYLLMPVYLLIAVVFSQLFHSGYEAHKMDLFRQALAQYFPNFWDIPANGKFLVKCVQYYYFFPLLLGGLSVFYLWKRRWGRLGWVWISTLGYLLLVHYSSPNTTYRFYAEVTYLPLSIFVATPFLFEIMPSIGKPQWWLIALALLMVDRVLVIRSNAPTFTQRLDWLERRIGEARQQEGGKRFYTNTYEAPMDTLIMPWGVAYESLLLTALESPDSAATLFIQEAHNKQEEALRTPDLFIAAFDQLPARQLPDRYFQLGSGLYRWIEE